MIKIGICNSNRSKNILQYNETAKGTSFKTDICNSKLLFKGTVVCTFHTFFEILTK